MNITEMHWVGPVKYEEKFGMMRNTKSFVWSDQNIAKYSVLNDEEISNICLKIEIGRGCYFVMSNKIDFILSELHIRDTNYSPFKIK